MIPEDVGGGASVRGDERRSGERSRRRRCRPLEHRGQRRRQGAETTPDAAAAAVAPDVGAVAAGGVGGGDCGGAGWLRRCLRQTDPVVPFSGFAPQT